MKLDDQDSAAAMVRAVEKASVPVITLAYNEKLLQTAKGEELAARLIEAYEKLSQEKNTASVVVQFDAEVVGAEVNRALIELYRVVRKNGGELVCVGYPSVFLPTLHSLGISSEPGFILSSNLDQAVRRIERRKPAA